jgi:two-component system chemotaxis response regulator CheY
VKPVIICIDDQREVLAALRKDLANFSRHFELYDCESASEASEVLDEIDAAGQELVLVICDHVMPGKSGVDFLTDLRQDLRFPRTKKLLLTGLATQKDTIQAINQARIDRFIEKPWQREQLLETVKQLLAIFFAESGLEYQEYLPMLDQIVLFQELRRRS